VAADDGNDDDDQRNQDAPIVSAQLVAEEAEAGEGLPVQETDVERIARREIETALRAIQGRPPHIDEDVDAERQATTEEQQQDSQRQDFPARIAMARKCDAHIALGSALLMAAVVVGGLCGSSNCGGSQLSAEKQLPAARAEPTCWKLLKLVLPQIVSCFRNCLLKLEHDLELCSFFCSTNRNMICPSISP
jgi:hypothetical protein